MLFLQVNFKEELSMMMVMWMVRQPLPTSAEWWKHVKRHHSCSCALSHKCDLVWVTPECNNVALNPLQQHTLVVQRIVARRRTVSCAQKSCIHEGNKFNFATILQNIQSTYKFFILCVVITTALDHNITFYRLGQTMTFYNNYLHIYNVIKL